MISGTIRAGRAFVELFVDNNPLTRGLKAAERKIYDFGKRIHDIGRQLTMLGLSASVPFAASIKTFATFDDNMRAVAATIQATDAEFQRLCNTAKTLGRTTTFTANQVSAAMLELGRAGFNQDMIEASIGSVLDLSRATGATLSDSTKIAINTLYAFNMAAGDMARICDALVAGANASSMDITDLAYGLKYCSTIASEFGLTLEETVKMIGALSNVGVKGSMAGTSFRRILTNLTDPKIQKKVESLGVAVRTSSGSMRKASDILKDLGHATDRLPSGDKLSLFKEIFSLWALPGAVKLTGADFEELNKALDNSAGRARQTAKGMDAGIGGSFRRMWAVIEGLAIAIGDALAPAIKEITDFFVPVINGVTKYIEANKKLVVQTAKIVAAVIGVGIALMAFGIALTGASMIFSTVAAAISIVTSSLLLLLKPLVLCRTALLVFGRVSAVAFGGIVRVVGVLATIGRAALLAFGQAVILVFRGLFRGVFTAIGGIIRALRLLTTIGIGTVRLLVAAFRGIAALIVTVCTTIGPAIVSILGPVLASLAHIFAPIIAACQFAFAAVCLAARYAFGSIVAIITRIFALAGGQILAAFALIGRGLMAVLAPLGSAIMGVFALVGRAIFASLTSIVMPILTAIGSAILTALSTVASVAMTVVVQMIAAITTVVAGGILMVGSIITGIFAQILAFCGPVVAAIAVIGAGIGLLIVALKGLDKCLGYIDANLGSLVSGTISAFVSLASGIFGFLKGLVSGVISTVNMILSPFISVGSAIISLFASVISGVWSFIGPFVTDMASVFISVAQWILTPITSAFQTISSTVVSILGHLVSIVSQIAGWIGAVFVNTFNWVVGTIGNLATQVGSIVTSAISCAMSAVTSVLSNMWSGLSSMFIGLFEGISEIIVSFTNFFMDAFGRIGDAVDWLRDQFGELASYAGTAYEAIVAAFRKGDIEAAVAVIWTSLMLAWVKGTNFLLSIWYWLADAVQDVWFDCVYMIAEVFVKSLSGIESAWAEVVYSLRLVWFMFINAVMEGWDSAAKAAAKTWAYVKSLAGGDSYEVRAAQIDDEYKKRGDQRQADYESKMTGEYRKHEAAKEQRQSNKKGVLGVLDDMKRTGQEQREQARADRTRWMQQREAEAQVSFGLAAGHAMAPPENPDTKPLTERLREKLEGITAGLQMPQNFTGAKLSVAGTFHGAMAGQMAGGGVMDRIAKATEKSEQHLAQLAKKDEPQKADQKRQEAKPKQGEANDMDARLLKAAEESVRIQRDILRNSMRFA